MSLADILSKQRLDHDRDIWRQRLDAVTPADVEAAIATRPGHYEIEKLLALISPAAESYLESMAGIAQALTLQRFGRTIKLYVPLYVSNYCVNRCSYCGFNAG